MSLPTNTGPGVSNAFFNTGALSSTVRMLDRLNDNRMLHFKVATTDFLFLDSSFKAQLSGRRFQLIICGGISRSLILRDTGKSLR